MIMPANDYDYSSAPASDRLAVREALHTITTCGLMLSKALHGLTDDQLRLYVGVTEQTSREMMITEENAKHQNVGELTLAITRYASNILKIRAQELAQHGDSSEEASPKSD